MPVEDVTVEWPEALSPFVTVAKLRIPQHDISAEDNLEKMGARRRRSADKRLVPLPAPAPRQRTQLSFKEIYI
jgi:hypothetical protein